MRTRWAARHRQLLAGLAVAGSALLGAAVHAQTQTQPPSVCAAKPGSLPAGTPAPVPGSAYHYTQPTLNVAANHRMLSVETWTSSPDDVFGSSRRAILWDTQSLQPLRLYYVARAQRTPYAQRAVGRHAVALRGDYKTVSLSADGRHVAFGFEDRGGATCTDVYEDGALVAQFPGLGLLAFFGNDLVLSKTSGGPLEELQLLSLQDLGNPVRQWQPPAGLRKHAGVVRGTAGQGRFVVFDSENVFDVQGWKLIAEHHCGFRCTTVKPTGDEKLALERASVGHPRLDNPRLGREERDGRTGFGRGGIHFVHDGPALPGAELSARVISEDHLAVQWKELPEGSKDPADAIHYLRLYDIATGQPLHAAPLQTPGWGSGYVMHAKGGIALLDDKTVLFVPAHNAHESSERVSLVDGDRHLVTITSPPAESRAIAQRSYAEWQARKRAAEERQASLANQPEASLQEQFVQHIERYGPDTTDSSTFHYQVQLYCSYGGKQCQAMQARARNFQDQRNQAAEQANMRRIWQAQGPGGGQSLEEFGRKSRERVQCLQRATESIRRQAAGLQSLRENPRC